MHPVVFAELWQGTEWISVAGWGRGGRSKKPVNSVLALLKWHRVLGVRYALVSDFLDKAGKQNANVGQSVAHWKKTLRGLIFKKQKVVGQCVSEPWMATAATFKKVYASFK